ncbi:hypothetical protein L1987_05467 [Smallanthus sonchifolius]|uniref:Uncharacterized protein n=3 Tax=Smallanthus sonchifolius TaxID=185202 RepID=A0ACB9JVN7_9ASTR|nr:hypothetical protein L1987_67795 [Smallanthus sonchifolius]KAI3761994.1 hypothetical protein L1987_52417 [Smallanthus sonchifolius]KAI3824020.1 hypothetical protein L1987_05467 [Smallanthus sonchifolius]
MIRGEERRRKGDQQITETLNKVHVLREVAEKAGATADVQRLLSLLEMLKGNWFIYEKLEAIVVEFMFPWLIVA